MLLLHCVFHRRTKSFCFENKQISIICCGQLQPFVVVGRKKVILNRMVLLPSSPLYIVLGSLSYVASILHFLLSL